MALYLSELVIDAVRNRTYHFFVARTFSLRLLFVAGAQTESSRSHGTN